ncbi:alpha/beta fold hydrolase [Cohnella nanjingensis]|uniref:Alpha/beta fold hydrolase n=1 Tax=Cohnella nanjingensis TaxID=1387779 RepID=A0A7X0RQS9_9BACL|nr:alpha/beta fold hydrolase [Cohnella nanjingensis]MBB6670786.1 alpha/beta fold hydrolase [Cohnella nanjingensis]
MPLIDMPLSELQTYGGISPRPVDFDDYWERALAEMRSVEPAVELIESDFKHPAVDCFDLYYTGVRNARIHAKYLRPKAAPAPHPAVVLLHGYAQNSGDWSEKLAFASMGYSVVAMDCRGQGGLSEDPGGVKGTTHHGHIIRGLDDEPGHLLFRHIFLDAAQLAGIVMGMPEVDPDRVGVTGWSQGGGLTLACAALEPRLKKAAPVYPFLCDYRRVWEMDLAKDAYRELSNYFRNHDPRHEREDEIFAKLGYIDVQFLAPRISAEVLLGVGLMDTVCPPSTQFAAYNKITAPKRTVVYPDFAHERLPDMHDLIVGFMADL